MDKTPESDSASSSLASWLVRLVLARRSMIVLDSIILLFGSLTMIYALLRYFDIIGNQSFIEDSNFTLDLFEGIADVFVFYGVALESRSHLLRAVLRREGHENEREEKLDGASEYTGIILVVLGLLLELASHGGLLAMDAGLDEWVFFPLCLFGFAAIGVILQQLVLHLIAVIRIERRSPGWS